MQFSFLTALFGGKAAGDVLANAKPDMHGNPAAKDAEGFFSFLEGLLKPAQNGEAGKESGAVDVLAGSLFTGQPQPLNPIAAARVKGAVEGLPVTPEPRTPGLVKTEIRPSTNPLTPGQVALSPEPPKGPVWVEGPVLLETVAPQAASPFRPFVDDSAVAPDLVSPAKSATAPSPAQVIAGTQTAVLAAKKLNAAETGAVPEKPAASVEAAPELDGRSRDAVSRFDTPLVKATVEGPTIVLPQQANAAVALADNASPEAFAHSAVTRDEAVALDAERMSASRLEIVSPATDRNAHLNPVRDQVVAAVAARQGDGKLEIRLDPPELGKILIGFDRDGTDIVRAVISADSPETLDLMRRHADVFQRALEAQGFDNLDLHFTDKGAGENAGEMAEEAFRNLRLADDAGQADVVSPAPHLVDGRLDRRL